MTILKHFSLLIGLSACLIGVLAILKPKTMSEGFGIKIDGRALNYLVALGIRDIFMGLSIISLYLLEHWLMIGYTSLFVSLVALSDFLVVYNKGEKKTSFVHFSGLIISLVYGIVMITGLN